MSYMAFGENWKILERYLVTTRYSVRDPKSQEPLEFSYEDMLFSRILPGLRKLNVGGSFLSEGRFQLLEHNLTNRLLIPATPFLMSFGNSYTSRFGYFSCYPLGHIPDHLSEIDKYLSKMRRIYTSGGGVGIDLSLLRSSGSAVDNGQGFASGPVGFLQNFDAVTGTTNQGGRRRGALLVQLDWEHPDIRSFIRSKRFTSDVSRLMMSLPLEERPLQNPHLSNMNISVNAYGKFWDSKDLIREIAECMHRSGDPGLLFTGNMLKYSPVRSEDEPKFSNPCGEYLSSANTACNLVTINVGALSREVFDELGGFGFSRDLFLRRFYERVEALSESALDLGNIILNLEEGYPLPEIREASLRMRPVGVGMSGFHTALILAGQGESRYGDDFSLRFGRELQGHIVLGTLRGSQRWSRERELVYSNPSYWNSHLDELEGSLGFVDTISDLRDFVKLRGGFYNCVTTSQAPTGSTSIFLRNLDTGIEPYYALEVNRKVKDAAGWLDFSLTPYYIGDLLASDSNFYELVKSQVGFELDGFRQLDILSSFQYHCHTGVSKTINLPSTATVEDIEGLIYHSEKLRLKGFTVYRDSSLEGVLSTPQTSKKGVSSAVPLDVGTDRNSRTFTARSGNLTSHITITHDEANVLREVFISAGDVGASINSLYSALGMVLSASLRAAPWLFSDFVKVLCKVRMGERCLSEVKFSEYPIVGESLPQCLGLLLESYQKYLNGGEPKVVTNLQMSSSSCDICPSCQDLSLRREGSCFKCSNCGYSSC